ncbi:MAG: aminotransferase class V-fold PLP-dependent enzyme [bacterium]|nr:aminotransferase class V-fold PLP-dependent enzyme [bacterium]
MPQSRPIYLDHASTTPLDRRVFEAMKPFFLDVYGNPSSLHRAGLKAKEAVMESRATIAHLLNAHPDEIVFTGSGTESDSLAILGTINAIKIEKPHVITSAIEHHAVLEPLQYLKKTGKIDLTILPVSADGLVDVGDVKQALTLNTVLVTIMAANNEIGTIQPIADIGRAILAWRKEHGTAYPYFHSDACQAAGALDINVEQWHTDLLTMNGSKIYGPKGIGLLFVRRGTTINPMIRGGGQERGLRSGTENVPAIVGFAQAFKLAQADREKENARLTALRDRLIKGLMTISKTRLNGHATKRLPNNVNISFLDTEGEATVLYLDAADIMASTGSACASSSLDASHVIIGLGLPYEAAHGSVRFSLGHDTTAQDADRVIEVMKSIIERLREMSPVNVDMKYYA